MYFFSVVRLCLSSSRYPLIAWQDIQRWLSNVQKHRHLNAMSVFNPWEKLPDYSGGGSVTCFRNSWNKLKSV